MNPEQFLDAVRRLKGQGERDADIAMATGVPIHRVKTICKKHDIRRPTNGRIDIPTGIRMKLLYQAEAARRGIPLNRFVREILRIVHDDNLFTAILDDKK